MGKIRIKSKHWLVPGFLLINAGLLLSGCTLSSANKGLEASGTIEATEVSISSELSGKLANLKVAEGDKVKAGQVLARLDDRGAKAQLKNAQALADSARAKLADTKEGSRIQQIHQGEAAVQQAQALLKSALETKDNAYKNWVDLKEIKGQGGVTQKDLDSAATRYKTAEAQYDAAVAQVKQAQEQVGLLKAGATSNTIKAMDASLAQAEANLELAKVQLDKTIITAPKDGTVAAVLIDQGETTVPGSPVINLLDLNNKWVKVYVPEDQLGQVKLGQGVKVKVDAFKTVSFDGKVTFIAKEAEFTPRNVQTKEERVNMVFAVKVTINDPKDQLKPGLPADILFGEG